MREWKSSEKYFKKSGQIYWKDNDYVDLISISVIVSIKMLGNDWIPRKFKGGICCGSHLAVTYGGELRIFHS